MNDFQLSPNFNLREFQCKCCGQVKLQHSFLVKLQGFRDTLGVPIVSNSSYRCEINNERCGGRPNSYHRLGRAVDIIVHHTGMTMDELYRAAVAYGWGGVIAYPKKGIVHVDNRDGVWHDPNGK